MARWVDIADKGVARGTDGQSPANYWNLADILLAGSVAGETVNIKGVELALTSVPQRIDDAGEYVPWGPMVGHGIKSTSDPVGDTFLDNNDTQYTLKRIICNWTKLNAPQLLQSCGFYTAGDITFQPQNQDFDVTIDVKGCTFHTNDNSIIVNNYNAGTLRQTTVRFYSTLFIDTVFDAGSDNKDVIYCENCTFVGKTEAEVKAAFEDTGNTITFVDCRFNQTLAGHPSDVANILTPAKKEDILFSTYDDDTEKLRGPSEFDYSTHGKGFFGGERIGVGAFWFENIYYADLDGASSHGIGDGLSYENRFGLDDFNDMCDGGSGPVGGRVLRERDQFLLDADVVYTGSEYLQFPYGNNDALHDLDLLPSGSGYPGITFEPRGEHDAVKLDMSGSSGGSNFGDKNIFHRFVLSIKSASNLAGSTGMHGQKWYDSIFHNSVELHIYGDPDTDWDIGFIGCTFATKKVEFDGAAGASRYILFDGCHFPKYDSVDCIWAEKVGYTTFHIKFTGNCAFSGSQSAVLAGISMPPNTLTNAFYILADRKMNQAYPTTFSTYAPATLDFWDFDLNGSLTGTTSSTEGPWGYARSSLGGYYFGSPEPGPFEYYADLNQVPTGAGTVGDPWNDAQVILYLEGTPGYQVYDGDKVYCKGSLLIDSSPFITLDFGALNNIQILPWDLQNNGMYIFEVDSSMSATNVILFKQTTLQGMLTVEHMVLLVPNGSCQSITVFDSDPGNSTHKFKNLIMIADEPVVLVDAISDDQQLSCYGCSLSIGANGSLTWYGNSTFTGSVTLYDSVIHGDTSAAFSSGTSSTVTWDHCETNRTEVTCALDVVVACDFLNTDANGPGKMPVSRTTTTFTLSEFVYDTYVLNNAGSGSTQWTAWGIADGVGGNPRDGIGGLYFVSQAQHYAYLDQVATGDGTEVSPWNLLQYLTYFDASVGADIGTIIPIGGDTVNVRGGASREPVNAWMTVDRTWLGEITVKAWDIEQYGPWTAEIRNNDAARVVFMAITNTSTKLTIQDFIYIHDNEQANQGAHLAVVSSGLTQDIELEFKNFMALLHNTDAFGIVNEDATYDVFVRMRGFNLSADDIEVVGKTNLYIYDGCLYVTGSLSTVSGTGSAYMEHCETNRTQADFTGAGWTAVTSTFESAAPEKLPAPFYYGEYDQTYFDYTRYGFANTGMGQTSWDDNGYAYGVSGEPRLGLGFLFYFVAVPPHNTPDKKPTAPCYESPIEGRTFWDYISTFWNYLTDNDRGLFENFWYGLTIVGEALTKKGLRFYEALAPENARTCVLDDYYDLQIGQLYSKPINLDPTIKTPNYTISPLRTILVEPTYDDLEPVHRDLIEITAADYNRIRMIGLDAYVVIQVKREGIADQYFKISNLYSSNEPIDRAASAELNPTIVPFDPVGDAHGSVRLTALDYMKDVSKYKVLSFKDTTSAVTWATDGLKIEWDQVDSIDDMVALINVFHVDRWCKAENISAKDATDFPVFADADDYPENAIDFEDLPNYIHAEEANGRNFPPDGKVWKYFEGYAEADGDPGTAGIGEYVDTPSKYRYLIEVEGSLSYIGIEVFTIYLTTGRAYDITPEVLSLPTLQSFIETGGGVQFKVDIDYTFHNQIVEFGDDIFANGRATAGEYLYCPKTPLIEDMLFGLYGGLTATPDWRKFNYNNHSGKVGINVLMRALQEATNRQQYEQALNAYYGLPIVPEKSEVIGLYESYGYTILAINGDEVILDIRQDDSLNPLIQVGCRFFVEDKHDALVTLIINRSVYDATLDQRVAKVEINGASYLTVGEKVHLRLNNRYIIRDFQAETSTGPGYIWIYSPEGEGAIAHLIDVVYVTSGRTRYPEIVVFGTKNLDYNFDGIYHITGTQQVGGITRLTVYKRQSTVEPLYNDFVGQNVTEIGAGFVHIPWPTHKFLLMLLETDKYFKAYLDAPIDTIYDVGDVLQQYDIVARNVSVLTRSMFPDWVQFDNFRKFTGINLESDILELTNVIPGAEFGRYFPSGYIETE